MLDELPEADDLQTPERFSDMNRSFRVEKLSGLSVHSEYGQPRVGILPSGKQFVQEEDEPYKDFIDRWQTNVAAGPSA